MFSDRDIEHAIQAGHLRIEPFELANIQPASVDLRLGDTFAALPPPHKIFPGYIDPLAKPIEDHDWKSVQPGLQYPLLPGAFALACTVEEVQLDETLVGELCGKSSLARCGLMVEAAGLVDPGFCGELTLELYNQHKDRTIMLTPGMLICQMTLHRLDSPAMHLYGSRKARSHYQGQRGPTLSRAHLKAHR